MQQSGWWRKQLRITWHLPVVLIGGVLLSVLALNWNRLTSHPPRVVRLSGTHYEMGLQHGRILSREIRELYNAYVLQGLCQKEGYAEADLVSIGRHYDRFIPEDYRQEMRGIAEGANIPYERILVINTFADATLGKTPRACSALAVSTNQGLLVGRNLDWINHKVAHKSGIVFLLEPKDGHRILSVSWPGLVGVVTGMNDQQLTLSLNLAFATDLDSESTPCLFRLRSILEKTGDLQTALQQQIAEPRTIAMNVLIASGREKQAVVLELSGRQYAVVPMKAGHVVATNFYQLLPIHGGSGSDRNAILNQRLNATGTSTAVEDVESDLGAVRFLGPPDGMVTNQSVVFVPSQLAAYVAIGKFPATSGRYYRVGM